MKSIRSYESLEPGRKVVVITFLFVAAWYLTWRLGTINREALVFSWLLYTAEAYGLCTTAMHLFMTWRLTIRESLPPPEGAAVDVFVTTINEPVSLVRKTLLAVLNMDYPHLTWLLDDGRRPEMEMLARELGCRYLSRPDNKDAKAGNLNHALSHTSGDFIAVFDSDHAPKKGFLSKTLGYFSDPQVAFVQTPQDFYNLDSFQHHEQGHGAAAWHEQSVFFRVIQRGKDYWNAAFFCGSCAVIRRSALQSIGGFATGTVTEDLHTSVRIHKKGWRSIYHAEPLAFGLAPSEVASFLNQRIRWGQGAMQVWRKEGVFFCRGLTMAQRINYLASSITYFDGWHKGFFYIIPAVVLTTGVMPVSTFGRDFLIHFVPYFLFTFWAFEEVNRGYGRSLIIEEYNMARFAAMAWSTLGLFRDRINFSVTPKGNAPTGQTANYLMPQAMIAGLNVIAIVIGTILFLQGRHLPESAFYANVVWALVNSGLAFAVIRYVLAQGRHHRSEYRFLIPFPAVVEFADGRRIPSTVDDISCAGCRIYTAVPDGIVEGGKVKGTIFLPSGAVRFEAVVKTLIQGVNGEEHYVKSIGCSFLRSAGNELDQLDLFLYGSNLELVLNKVRETVKTPMDLLQGQHGRLFGREEGHPNWNAISFSSPEGTQGIGLISTDHSAHAPATILAYSPIPEGAHLKVNVHGHRGVTTVSGSVGTCTEIDTQLSPLFNCQFNQLSGGAS